MELPRLTKTSKGQVVERVTLNGPDPVQSEWWNGLAYRTDLELSADFGRSPSVRVGMKGSPPTTWYGDPGPLGGLPAASYGAVNAFPELDAIQALPATSSPSVTSQTLKGLLGESENVNAW